MPDTNLEIRAAAIAHCRNLMEVWERAVPGGELAKGFTWRGDNVQLMGPQGIFKPRQMAGEPLSLKSTLASSYEDEAIEGDLIFYDYAPRSREHENLWTRSLVGKSIPVVYLDQVCNRPSEYMIAAPVFVVGDDPERRKFALSTAAGRTAASGAPQPLLRPDPARIYVERTLRQRLHQAHFRKNVIAAYRTRCAVCELRVRHLLDGAHILPDTHPLGEPRIANGLSLCALHHRAFDRDILRVTPDYRVMLGDVVIHESDISAIRNLREYQGKNIWTPSAPELRPDPGLLRLRIELSA